MIEGLIGLLVLVLVLGVVVWLVIWLIDMLPMEPRFNQIAKAIVVLIAVFILLYRALPLIGVHL